MFKMCTCISTLIYVLTWLPMSVPPNLNSFMKTWVPLCDILCLSQSTYFWSHTIVRMCTCIITCIYVHLTPHFSLMPCRELHGKMCAPVWQHFVSHSPHYVASTCMECVHAPVHVLMWTWVLNSAPSPIHSYFGSSVWQCVYCSYLFSVSTPCLECVHALVHVFMSTWLPMLAPPHLNSYMKTWVALCGIVCLLQLLYFG